MKWEGDRANDMSAMIRGISKGELNPCRSVTRCFHSMVIKDKLAFNCCLLLFDFAYELVGKPDARKTIKR